MSGEVKNVIQNTLPLIVWKHEYDLGIHILDEHHRGILTATNSLYYEMQSNQGEGVLTPIFKIMHEYASIHFKTEEKFHEKFDFPYAVPHRALHKELMDTLSRTVGESVLHRDPHQFMNFLKKWWIGHICDKDRVFRDYLLEKSFMEKA